MIDQCHIYYVFGDDSVLSEIRNMTKDEMGILISAADFEGWNPGLHDSENFYACDPKGFWAGIDSNGDIVSTLGFVNYPDSDFSFVGLYIVMPEHRHQGNGYQLWKEVFERNPGRNVGLDGVSSQIQNYVKSGFAINNLNHRYVGRDISMNRGSRNLVDASSVNFNDLSAYDASHFPARREDFLRSWIKNSHRSIVYVVNNKIKGFGVIRECSRGYKIGPLFCDTHDIALDIFSELVKGLNKKEIYLDIMGKNASARALVDMLGMEQIFSTTRMYTGNCPKVDWNGVFGITSFELG